MGDCCLTLNEHFVLVEGRIYVLGFSYIMARISYIRWNSGDVRFVLDQQLDLYANSLKQHFAGKHTYMSPQSYTLSWFWAKFKFCSLWSWPGRGGYLNPRSIAQVEYTKHYTWFSASTFFLLPDQSIIF